MDTVRFMGRVRPFNQLTLATEHSITFTKADEHAPIRMTVSITDSVIRVACEIEEYRGDEHFHTMYELASDLARLCVSLASLSLGYGLIADLDTIVEPNSFPQLVLTQNKDVAEEMTSYKFTASSIEDRDELADLIQLLIKDPALGQCLHELSQVLSLQAMAPINCGRIIDSLRRIVAPGMKPIQGWPILRQVVNTDEAFMRWISDQSINPRHGERVELDHDMTIEIMRRTAAILNRFLEFRKRGNNPLPLPEFPLLQG